MQGPRLISEDNRTDCCTGTCSNDILSPGVQDPKNRSQPPEGIIQLGVRPLDLIAVLDIIGSVLAWVMPVRIIAFGSLPSYPYREKDGNVASFSTTGLCGDS